MEDENVMQKNFVASPTCPFHYETGMNAFTAGDQEVEFAIDLTVITNPNAERNRVITRPLVITSFIIHWFLVMNRSCGSLFLMFHFDQKHFVFFLISRNKTVPRKPFTTKAYLVAKQEEKIYRENSIVQSRVSDQRRFASGPFCRNMGR